MTDDKRSQEAEDVAQRVDRAVLVADLRPMAILTMLDALGGYGASRTRPLLVVVDPPEPVAKEDALTVARKAKAQARRDRRNAARIAALKQEG